MKNSAWQLVLPLVLCSCGAKNNFNYKNDFKILFIGNSFSQDTVQFMPNIADELGFNIEVCNLYYPGCTVSQHIDFIDHSLPRYNFEYFENGYWHYEEEVTANEYIACQEWDYISIQQASPYSGISDSYNKVDDLINSVKPLLISDKTQFVWNMTWAYEESYTNVNFESYGYSTDTMYNGIINVVKSKIAKNKNISLIIPNGTAIQNLRTTYFAEYDYVTRDGFHLSTGVGRYCAAMTTIKALTNCELDSLQFLPDGVDSDTIELCKESANNAFIKPFEVTKSKF